MKFNGFVNHVITEAFKRKGYEVKFAYLPWKRALTETKNGPYSALSYVYLTKDREKEFYLSAPISDEKIVFFHLKSNPIQNFGANYGKAVGEIRDALTAGDFEQAHSLVHSLKGLAGNLEATDLQASTVTLEKLVKGQTAETVSGQKLNRALAGLGTALNQALDAVRQLGSAAENTETVDPSPMPGLDKRVVDRINAAAEMGDVMQIESIAEGLLAESHTAAPFCDKLIRLAEDFDLDGIKNLLVDLNS